MTDGNKIVEFQKIYISSQEGSNEPKLKVWSLEGSLFNSREMANPHVLPVVKLM